MGIQALGAGLLFQARNPIFGGSEADVSAVFVLALVALNLNFNKLELLVAARLDRTKLSRQNNLAILY